MHINPKLLRLSKMLSHPCRILHLYTIFGGSDTPVDIFEELEQQIYTPSKVLGSFESGVELHSLKGGQKNNLSWKTF